jgi:glycosyltransferase involved in cell wall biosynthesis
LTLISVLVPVRDAEEYLDEALRSLAGQTHGEFEVIVVDDGSRDGSGEIAREWARRDARFRVVRQEPSHGDGPPGGVALGAVAGEAGRTRLRELAREQGRRDGFDFVAIA